MFLVKHFVTRHHRSKKHIFLTMKLLYNIWSIMIKVLFHEFYANDKLLNDEVSKVNYYLCI